MAYYILHTFGSQINFFKNIGLGEITIINIINNSGTDDYFTAVFGEI